MQWVADALVATIAAATDWLAKSWLSIVLLLVILPFARRRAPKFGPLRPTIVYPLVAVVALLAAMCQTIALGEPHPPWYSDDFGNVLTADTFARGRLSNPTHPLHRYFETLYVLQTPRYASMYPPGQALLLAGAQRVFGLRAVGLWLASAAACVAICWAVAAIVPLEIACVAGLLCAIHPTMMEWNGYYHVGALAAAAGALAIGGALRLSTQPRTAAALAMGSGIAILANTRPYEGFVIAVIACAFAIRRPRYLAIALAIAVVGLAFTAWYDRAVTGDPLLLPYNAYNARYLSAPNFIWQKPFPPRSYPTFEMETRYGIFRRYYERSRHPSDFLIGSWVRLKEMLGTALPSSRRPSWLNTLQPFAAVPLLFAVRRNRQVVAATILFVAAMLSITWWPQTHYFAPGAALFAVLYAMGVERMIDRGYGTFAYACVAVSFAIAIVSYAAAFLPQPRAKGPRMAVTEALDSRPGGQLVIADATCFDVVFNSAEIDAAKIVWAHAADGGVEPLLDYYRDREVWRLVCDPPFHLQQQRPSLAGGRSDYERDIYYPYHFRQR
jgi:hypothetical protein